MYCENDGKIDVNCSSQLHCVKSVRIGRFYCPYFSTFGLNPERYSVFLGIQSECGKIRTRKTPNKRVNYQTSNWTDTLKQNPHTPMVIHLVRAQNFPKNYYFLPPDTHRYVCVSEVSNVDFSKHFAYVINQ